MMNMIDQCYYVIQSQETGEKQVFAVDLEQTPQIGFDKRTKITFLAFTTLTGEQKVFDMGKFDYAIRMHVRKR